MDRLFCLLAVFLLVRQAESVTWEFGHDSGNLVVLSTMSGQFLPLEKVKRITIPIPTCMEVKHVLVEVINLLNTPSVSYNRNANTVTITYKLLEISVSKYDITAKGIISLQCSSVGGGDRNYRSRHGSGQHLERRGDRLQAGNGNRFPSRFPERGDGAVPNRGSHIPGNDRFRGASAVPNRGSHLPRRDTHRLVSAVPNRGSHLPGNDRFRGASAVPNRGSHLPRRDTHRLVSAVPNGGSHLAGYDRFRGASAVPNRGIHLPRRDTHRLVSAVPNRGSHLPKRDRHFVPHRGSASDSRPPRLWHHQGTSGGQRPEGSGVEDRWRRK